MLDVCWIVLTPYHRQYSSGPMLARQVQTWSSSRNLRSWFESHSRVTQPPNLGETGKLAGYSWQVTELYGPINWHSQDQNVGGGSGRGGHLRGAVCGKITPRQAVPSPPNFFDFFAKIERFGAFYARKQLLFSARLSHRNSVRLSVSPSVCPPVRPSVIRVDQSKTVQARITKFSPSAARKTLVSGTVKLFHKFEGDHPERKR